MYPQLFTLDIVTRPRANRGTWGSTAQAERMASRVRIDPETAGLVRLGCVRRGEGCGAQGERSPVRRDEVVHRQVEVQLLRRPVGPLWRYVVCGALKSQRDP